MDRHGAAVTVITAADTAGVKAARSTDVTAVDRHGAAVALITAADTAGVSAARSTDVTAVDRYFTGVAFITATDTRAVTVALRIDDAAVDGDGSAVTVITAADACAVFARCVDRTAVDDDRTRTLFVTTADTRTINGSIDDGERTRARGLTVDIERIALRDVDTAVNGERCAVLEDKIDRAADADARADGHVLGNHIPVAVRPRGGVACDHRVKITALRGVHDDFVIFVPRFGDVSDRGIIPFRPILFGSSGVHADSGYGVAVESCIVVPSAEDGTCLGHVGGQSGAHAFDVIGGVIAIDGAAVQVVIRNDRVPFRPILFAPSSVGADGGHGFTLEVGSSVPTDKNVILSRYVGGQGRAHAFLVRGDVAAFDVAAVQVIVDGAVPLRPKLFVTRGVAGDRCHGVAVKFCIRVPTGKDVFLSRYVGRQGGADCFYVLRKVAAIDHAAVRIKRYGAGPLGPVGFGARGFRTDSGHGFAVEGCVIVPTGKDQIAVGYIDRQGRAHAFFVQGDVIFANGAAHRVETHRGKGGYFIGKSNFVYTVDVPFYVKIYRRGFSRPHNCSAITFPSGAVFEIVKVRSRADHFDLGKLGHARLGTLDRESETHFVYAVISEKIAVENGF